MIDFEITPAESLGDDRHGRYECGPLERGYGITLGNSLRRVLLSSLDGAAITSIKIDGVLHEFSTVSGVREDVTDIILNLKKIRFKAHDEAEFPLEVRVDISKPGPFCAGDIRLPSEIEVLNKDLVLCNLDEGAHFGMEIKIGKGHGYVPFTKNKREEDPIGVIPIDSIYSPVLKCNYEVSDTRFGSEMNYDKLVLDLETDGSISATDAVAKAASILIECFKPFASLSDGTLSVETAEEPREEEADAERKLPFDPAQIDIDELDLSVRAKNCLKRAEIHMLDQLLDKSEDELTRVRNLGSKSLEEVKEKLGKYQGLGLHLKDPQE